MIQLRPKPEAFARRRLLLDESQSQSYMRSGYKVRSENVAAACASRLLTNAKVLARIAELQEIAARRRKMTIERVGDELDQAHELALEKGKCAAAVAATMAKARLYGLIVDRRETRTKGEFDGCSSLADICDVLVKEAGSVEQAMQQVMEMKAELERRMTPGSPTIRSSHC